MLADAYVRGLSGVNWTEAYQAMVTDAEVVPFNTFSFVDPSNGIKEGRGALENWKKLGYLVSIVLHVHLEIWASQTLLLTNFPT